MFGVLGNYTNRWGRDPVVFLGMLTHFISFLLIFYNLPDAAIHGYVSNAYGQLFDPSRYALFVAVVFTTKLWFKVVMDQKLVYTGNNYYYNVVNPKLR